MQIARLNARQFDDLDVNFHFIDEPVLRAHRPSTRFKLARDMTNQKGSLRGENMSQASGGS